MLIFLPEISIKSFELLNPNSIFSICEDTALKLCSSSLLNSSKQPQHPTLQRPKKILPIDSKSNDSSQQNTKTIFPKLFPSGLTVQFYQSLLDQMESPQVFDLMPES